jgi:hypothetical protein
MRIAAATPTPTPAPVAAGDVLGLEGGGAVSAAGVFVVVVDGSGEVRLGAEELSVCDTAVAGAPRLETLNSSPRYVAVATSTGLGAEKVNCDMVQHVRLVLS